MSDGATAALTREIADTGRGLVRLARYDVRWPDGFDLSSTGFFRSFFAPLLAIPFFLVVTALAASEGGAQPITVPTLVNAGLSQIFAAVGFPVVVAVCARPFGLTTGYAAFIILVNWAGLFIGVAACAIAPLTLFGKVGAGLFGFLWMLLFLGQLFVVWRAARETLSPDYGPALLMVVLSVAVGVAAEQASRFLVGLAF